MKKSQQIWHQFLGILCSNVTYQTPRSMLCRSLHHIITPVEMITVNPSAVTSTRSQDVDLVDKASASQHSAQTSRKVALAWSLVLALPFLSPTTRPPPSTRPTMFHSSSRGHPSYRHTSDPIRPGFYRWLLEEMAPSSRCIARQSEELCAEALLGPR